MYNDHQTQNMCPVKLHDWSEIIEKVYALHQSDTLHTEENFFKGDYFVWKTFSAKCHSLCPLTVLGFVAII